MKQFIFFLSLIPLLTGCNSSTSSSGKKLKLHAFDNQSTVKVAIKVANQDGFIASVDPGQCIRVPLDVDIVYLFRHNPLISNFVSWRFIHSSIADVSIAGHNHHTIKQEIVQNARGSTQTVSVSKIDVKSKSKTVYTNCPEIEVDSDS